MGMTETKDTTRSQTGELIAEHGDSEAENEPVSNQAENGESPKQSAEQLPLDQVFEVLKNQRRRDVLRYMRAAEGSVSLSEITEQIAAWENDKDVSQISSSERKRVYVGLYQIHLPKMDAMGIISFNKPRGIIELEEDLDVLYKYLDRGKQSEDPSWYMLSLGLSMIGALGLGSALILQLLSSLPIVNLVAGFLLVAFTFYAAFNLYWIRSNGSDDDSIPEV